MDNGPNFTLLWGSAIAQSLILRKTPQYFVENHNENANKQALL